MQAPIKRVSKKILTECDLTYLHIFPYSPRENTPASRMPQVQKNIIKQLTHKAQVMERLLEISTDPKELTKYIIPDFSHFKWQNESDNSFLERAKKLSWLDLI